MIPLGICLQVLNHICCSSFPLAIPCQLHYQLHFKTFYRAHSVSGFFRILALSLAFYRYGEFTLKISLWTGRPILMWKHLKTYPICYCTPWGQFSFNDMFKLKEKMLREFSGGLVVRTLGFPCHGLGSVPDWGTEMPQPWGAAKKKIKREWTTLSWLVYLLSAFLYRSAEWVPKSNIGLVTENKRNLHVLHISVVIIPFFWGYYIWGIFRCNLTDCKPCCSETVSVQKQGSSI